MRPKTPLIHVNVAHPSVGNAGTHKYPMEGERGTNVPYNFHLITTARISGEHRNVPLSMYFIDSQKPYASGDQALSWAGLDGLGVSLWVMKIIRFFHDEIRARVQLHDGELSA